MAHGEAVQGSLFIYAPNKIAPAVFTCLYALSAAGHIYQCFRYKAWKLVWLQPLCAAFFTLGYALREAGTFNYSYLNEKGELNDPNLIIYILSQIFIYICPPFLELFNYHILGHVFYYVPYLAPLAPGKVLSLFGVVMLIVEAINAIGASFASNPAAEPSTQKMGSNLTVAALSLQFACIVTFICLASVFHWRFMKSKLRSRVVTTVLLTLYVSMVLILARCVYRLVEHMGQTAVDLGDFESLKKANPILRYEVYLYIFEATLMLMNSVLWNVWNPARVLPTDHTIFLAQDGSGEIQGHPELDERTRTKKVASKFTFGLLFTNKPAQVYWELQDTHPIRQQT